MPTARFALQENWLDDITIKWSWFYKHVTVEYQGATIYEHHRRIWSKTEVPVRLPDNRELKLKLSSFAPKLTQYGEALPASWGSARDQARGMATALTIYAFMLLLVGIIALCCTTKLGGPWGSILWFAAAAFFLGIAYWAKRSLSILPYIVLLIVCGLVVVFWLLFHWHSFNSGMGFILCLLVYQSIITMQAILEQQRQEKEKASSTP